MMDWIKLILFCQIEMLSFYFPDSKRIQKLTDRLWLSWWRRSPIC